MFARGLNSIKTGGLLLSCACNPEWIISEPNKHSEYLGESEFTVDPFKLRNIKVLSEYQPSEIFQNEAGAP